MARLRACLKTTRSAVFGEKAVWQGATKENTPGGSSTEEQRSQTAFSAKTLRAAGLLSLSSVDSVVTARGGDAGARAEAPSPPWPKPKSPAAAPFAIFRQVHRECWNVLNRNSDFTPHLWAALVIACIVGASGGKVASSRSGNGLTFTSRVDEAAMA